MLVLKWNYHDSLSTPLLNCLLSTPSALSIYFFLLSKSELKPEQNPDFSWMQRLLPTSNNLLGPYTLLGPLIFGFSFELRCYLKKLLKQQQQQNPAKALTDQTLPNYSIWTFCSGFRRCRPVAAAELSPQDSCP